jgi:hypothetical protein
LERVVTKAAGRAMAQVAVPAFLDSKTARQSPLRTWFLDRIGYFFASGGALPKRRAAFWLCRLLGRGKEEAALARAEAAGIHLSL